MEGFGGAGVFQVNPESRRIDPSPAPLRLQIGRRRPSGPQVRAATSGRRFGASGVRRAEIRTRDFRRTQGTAWEEKESKKQGFPLEGHGNPPRGPVTVVGRTTASAEGPVDHGTAP